MRETTILLGETKLRNCQNGLLLRLKRATVVAKIGPDLYELDARLYTTNVEQPSLDDMEEWLDGTCPTICGCDVEPDGECEHGCRSWLGIMGFV